MRDLLREREKIPRAAEINQRRVHENGSRTLGKIAL
jgi:hypothetical protein